MSDEAPRVTTEERRDWFHRGRRTGGVCCACCRPLGDHEPVYWEMFLGDIDLSVDGSRAGAEAAADGHGGNRRSPGPLRAVRRRAASPAGRP